MFGRACGDTPGAVYSKDIHGDHNMMMIQFDSASYPDITPGAGFRVKVEAVPSGKLIFRPFNDDIYVHRKYHKHPEFHSATYINFRK